MLITGSFASEFVFQCKLDDAWICGRRGDHSEGGPELTLLFGLLKFAVLVRLKNSALRWKLWDSADGNVTLHRHVDVSLGLDRAPNLRRCCQNRCLPDLFHMALQGRR